MKTPRKLTSLLLALLLVFALAATAAADDTSTTTNKGSITVDNPIKNQEYKAYKIFDVVYDDATPTQHYSYTIKDDSPWFETVKAYATPDHGLTLTEVAGTTPTTYVVTIDDTNATNKFSAPSFADALKKATVTDAGYTLQAENGGKPTANNLPLGYYFVTSTNGALCNLTTTDPTVTIHDKNDVPFVKTAPETSVEVGQKVNYTITGKVPDTTGFDEYTYEITDTMSAGLTFQKDVKVSIGTTEITDATNWIIYTPAAENATGFKLTIPVKDYQNQVSAEIKIAYSAVVNEEAVATVSTNNAVLKYSNNPTKKDQTTEKPPEVHKVYSAKITVNKFWKDGETEKPLANVGFKLYKNGTAENGGADKKLYYVKNPDKAVTWTEHVDQATQVMTSDTGEANFTGLANGTYYLVETKTPAGFNPLTGPETFEVKGDDTGANLTVSRKIENKTGAVLPSTGGMGTTVFYVLGAVLVVGAGVLLVTKKRMSRNEG